MDGSRPSTPFDNHGSPHLVTAASMYVAGPFFPPPSRPGPPTPGAGGGDLESDASRQTRPPQFLLPRNECLLPLPRYTTLDRIKHSPSHHPHTPFSPRRHGRENITGNHQGDHQGEREKKYLGALPADGVQTRGRQAGKRLSHRIASLDGDMSIPFLFTACWSAGKEGKRSREKNMCGGGGVSGTT